MEDSAVLFLNIHTAHPSRSPTTCMLCFRESGSQPHQPSGTRAALTPTPRPQRGTHLHTKTHPGGARPRGQWPHTAVITVFCVHGDMSIS